MHFAVFSTVWTEHSIHFINYSAAFDTKSQMFLDEALAEAGVDAKVRRIGQALFAAGIGVVRLTHPDGRHDDTLRAIRHRQRSTPGGHLLARCIHRWTEPDLPDASPPKPRRCS